jgi:hypothetical protein
MLLTALYWLVQHVDTTNGSISPTLDAALDCHGRSMIRVRQRLSAPFDRLLAEILRG